MNNKPLTKLNNALQCMVMDKEGEYKVNDILRSIVVEQISMGYLYYPSNRINDLCMEFDHEVQWVVPSNKVTEKILQALKNIEEPNQPCDSDTCPCG